MSDLISIIMPVFNSEDFLGSAINSVKQQTYKNWELIIIDDGSTDSSYEMVQSFASDDIRIKLIRLFSLIIESICFIRPSRV